MVDFVFDIGARAALDQQANHGIVSSHGGLMKGCRMRVHAGGIELVGVRSGIEEETDDIGVSVLS